MAVKIRTGIFQKMWRKAPGGVTRRHNDPGRGRGQYMGKCGQLVIWRPHPPPFLASNLTKWAGKRRRDLHVVVMLSHQVECLWRFLANSSVVSWPVPVVTTHPMWGLCGHRAVDLGPGAVQHGGGQLCVLGGRKPGHGVGAMLLRVRHRPRVSMVSSVSLVSLRVHIHHETACLWGGRRLRARVNVGV